MILSSCGLPVFMCLYHGSGRYLSIFLIDDLDESLLNSGVNYASYILTWADSVELVSLTFSELSTFV
jgi:hypothetical protein